MWSKAPSGGVSRMWYRRTNAPSHSQGAQVPSHNAQPATTYRGGAAATNRNFTILRSPVVYGSCGDPRPFRCSGQPAVWAWNVFRAGGDSYTNRLEKGVFMNSIRFVPN